jgi:hypothetical protein
MKKIIAICLILNSTLNGHAQITESDGDWSAHYVNLMHSPEAEQMIRYGDVDNLGFGWGIINPFSGAVTPKHTFPWTRDVNDSLGFDMVMVTSSTPYTGCVGYSFEKNPLLEAYGRSTFEFKFPTPIDASLRVKSIAMQLFLDDVQTRYRPMAYKVYINDRRAEFIENIISKLDQSGSIGKLITMYVPEDFISEFTKPELRFRMDDSSSLLCEGFAIDFIKILYNPTKLSSGHIKFIVKDSETNQPIPNSEIKIIALNQTYKTNESGEIIVQSLPSGYLPVLITTESYKSKYQCIDVIADRLEYVTISIQDASTANSKPSYSESNNKTKNCDCPKVAQKNEKVETQNNTTEVSSIINNRPTVMGSVLRTSGNIVFRIFVTVLSSALSGSSSSGSSSKSGESTSGNSSSGGSTRRR